MSTKIKCLNPIAKVGLDLFDDKYEITENFEEADGVLVRSAAMHDLELPDNLKAIARAGAGVNNIPLDKCAEKGIVVFNTPGANANGVKELVIAGLLLASRDIVGGIDWVKDNLDDENINKSAEKAKKAFAGHEIKGKKLGIIGLGAIGVLVANAATALGMEVYGCDPYLSVNNALNLSRSVNIVKERSEIYENCDFITVHVPLLDDTKGMINEEAISQMKDGVVILNFARDILVNEEDLSKALGSGKVAKYVSDFPNKTSVKMKNTIVIPHLGASTEESEDNCAVMAAKEMMDYIENGNIINSVNYPKCDAGVCTSEGRITICHKNIPNIITKCAGVFSSEGINIDHMVNKSRGDFAYSMFDIDAASTEDMVKKLEEVEGILKVRIVK
ncbi:MAG: 3-phosphoglycerate dehydrogenase family protein [Lachnospiraceae bacterium]|nr:3-phosphoglycerate dehydrogenase family protein [Lachnoclostridium sp.]MDD7521669.1 3-phosphoglycerate dehydrogenase family protein [Lachnoclostridium sp.]MDY2599229.1 3-phosphoglycerate dehydrogenase family protein [Lachnospiraceae bacterium]